MLVLSKTPVRTAKAAGENAKDKEDIKQLYLGISGSALKVKEMAMLGSGDAQPQAWTQKCED